MEGMSIREASRMFGLRRDTVRKMPTYSVPPGCRRQTTPKRPKLEPFTGVIDQILEKDDLVPGNSATQPSASTSGSGTQGKRILIWSKKQAANFASDQFESTDFDRE